MKKLYLFLYCVSLGLSVNAQVYSITSTLTPYGVAVEGLALQSGELSNGQKDNIKDDILDAHPNVTFLSEATESYNCHSFAWNMSEGGSTMWINAYDQYYNQNVERYWGTNGGYIEVCSISDATKIHYYAGDHSAIKSSVSGKYESKWGNGILVRHDPTDVLLIYQGTYQRYYAPVDITGPDHFCSTANYQILNQPSGTTVTWSASGVISVPPSSTGTSVTASSSLSGTGTITATITNSCGSATISRSVPTGYVFPAIQHDAGTNVICASSINNYFSIPAVAGATYYNWSVYPVPASYSITGNGTNTIAFGTNNPGTYALRLAITNACGTANANELTLTVLSRLDPDCGFLQRFVVYPNPAGDELSVTKVDESQQSNSFAGSGDMGKDNTYSLKLFDERGKLQAAAKSSSNNKDTTIPTGHIPTGTYYLHISEGNNIIKKQVLIKH